MKNPITTTTEDFENKWDVVYEQIKFRMVVAIGLDSAMDLQREKWTVSPFSLLASAVYKNMLLVSEINKDVVDEAIDEARHLNNVYKDSGEGIGSSDHNHFIYNMLNGANLKTEWIDGSMTRVDENGKPLYLKNELPTKTMFEQGGNITKFNYSIGGF